ncbi:DNA-binding transcriptional ArsR family regulator [Ochrobactrum sp. 19YEA23]|uniref:ArsR/SmtB family transcription factor n=1 Tax=Ochrobactrum sp. 19YEA23 TaxID=3039854 RepID=UPI0024786801|nr:DNA-binding transcriptional ArsR family regulator [Ochrobactrum sp. 19YEA23]
MSDVQAAISAIPSPVPLDEIFKALGNPVRLEILSWLKEPEKHFSAQHMSLEMGVCAGQFERCGLSQSTVSAHLSVLTKAGLIKPHRVGQWTFYKRDEEAIAAFIAMLSDL